MNSWFFPISSAEIDHVAQALLARHGEGAREEALRLAEVGRRIGSRRNSKIFRLAAQRLVGGDAEVSGEKNWLARIRAGLAEFGAPLTPSP